MEFLKSSEGVPEPDGSVYWSVSHKREYVAGVVAPYPAGIDIEKIRPCSSALISRVAEASEWELSTEIPQIRFFRFWTAKEAVLKAEGVGFAGFSSCRIHSVESDSSLTLDYLTRRYRVEQIFFRGHLATVVCGGLPISWEIVSEASGDGFSRG